SYPAALFVVLLASLLSAVPLTPAGLGVVEAGAGAVRVGVLGMDPGLALAVILLDRVVSYWNVLIAGGLLYLRRLAGEVRQAAAAPGQAVPAALGETGTVA
ncbi:MAG: lysylphosphatidylglycerol synthase domain-containing protein, partial [Chloroflexota bacterium]